MSVNHAKYLQALGIQTWQSRNQTAEVNTSASVVFISDIVEFNEDQESSADTLFTAMLNAIQLKREDVVILKVSKDQFQQLDKQINQLKPKIMMVMGNTAARYLLETQEPLDSLRSKIHFYGKSKTPLIISLPPAHLLRNPTDKRKSYQDLLFLYQSLRNLA